MTAPAPAVARTPRQRQADKVDTPQVRAAAAAGDRAAFALLWSVHSGAVHAFIWRRVGDRVLAEDLLSDTAVRALRNIDRGRYQDTGVSFVAWLVTIARNLIADHFKSGYHRLERSVPFDVSEVDGVVDGVVDAPGAEAEALERVRDQTWQRSLRAALVLLSPEQRDVVQLRFFEELTVSDTAAKLGIDEGAVKARQYRAVRTLARTCPWLRQVWEGWTRG